MSKLSFRGGIHPHDEKEMTKGKPVRLVMPKSELIFPLSQNIGNIAVPVVTVGERVLEGQLIAKGQDEKTAPVFASVSGVVTAIEERLSVNKEMVYSIVIQNDGEYEEYEPTFERTDESKENQEKLIHKEIIERIKKAGITEMLFGGRPVYPYLMPKNPDKIDYVIINCMEREPYITENHIMIMEESKKLIFGLKIMLGLFPHARGILAVEEDYADGIALLKKSTMEESRILVKTCKNKYPQSEVNQLIYATTKRKSSISIMPLEVGCIVLGGDTVLSILEAVMDEIPQTRRRITVTGNAIKEPGNFIVRLGTSMKDLLEEAGGFIGNPATIIAGGPMKGIKIDDLNVPITKEISALIGLSKDETIRWKEEACIHCGRCVSTCPVRLVPTKLEALAKQNDEEEFLKHGGMECCECGCCSYVCPAKKNVSHSIISMKKLILEKRAEKQEEFRRGE